MIKNFALLTPLIFCAALAHSKDHGVQGIVWPIIEVDVRQLLLESASKADWAKVQTEIKTSASRYFDTLPKRQMPVVQKTQTAWIDPSIVLSSDIQAPVQQPDGKITWQILYPKGTKANPLAANRPVTAMLFFDGSQPEQVELVRSVLALEPNRIVPVEAGAGEIKVTNQTLKRPVFFANDAMIARFQVRYLPSLLYAGADDHSLFLGLTSFALPFKPTEVIASWSDLAPSPVIGSKSK